MDDYNNIYPQLPTANVDKSAPQTGENFRLKQCSEWLAYLERELDARKNIYKKYNRVRSFLLNVATASGTMSVALSASGLGTGMTGVGLPGVISLGAMGGLCAVVSAISGGWAKMILKIVSKHEITVSLCRTKLNTIKDIVSKALDDNKISHEEFILVKSEVDKYHEMRNSIRRKYQKHPSQPGEPTRPTDEDIEKIKNEIHADLRGKALINCNCFTIVMRENSLQTETDDIRNPPAYNPDY